MRTRVLAVAVLFSLVAAVISPVVLAQPAPTSNYTSFEATPDKPVQLGYYASAHKSTCSPAPLPEVRVIEPPKSGLLIVRRATLTTNQIADCPGLKAPVQVVLYQARAGSGGSDHIVYKVTNSDGEVGSFDVTITIKEAPKPTSGTKEKI